MDQLDAVTTRKNLLKQKEDFQGNLDNLLQIPTSSKHRMSSRKSGSGGGNVERISAASSSAQGDFGAELMPKLSMKNERRTDLQLDKAGQGGGEVHEEKTNIKNQKEKLLEM